MNRFLSIFLYLSLAACCVGATTQTVTKTADTNDGVCDADCSLREAIDVAVSGDSIEFSPLFSTPQVIPLSGTELLIDKSLTITGPGVERLSVSGSNQSRVINVIGPSISVNISHMRISDGDQVANGGGILIQSGIVNLIKVSVSHNFVVSNTGGSVMGAGIDNFGGTVMIEHSLISDNFALTSSSGFGAGISNGRILNPATLLLTNSTVSGNTIVSGGTSNGGGINNARDLVMTHVTITQNTSSGVSGLNNGFLSSDSIANTIIAGNAGNRDVFGNFQSQGFNLIGDGTGSTNLNQPTDQVGSTVAPISPMLAGLSNNGGPTLTHKLQTGSPAIDQGSNFGFASDQRGQNRPVDDTGIANAVGGDGSDIGAFESLGPTAALAGVSGRVLAGKRGAVIRAVVTLTDTHGTSRSTLTNHFGYFFFEEIEVGGIYVVSADAKGLEFTPGTIMVNNSIEDLVITANQ